MYSIPQSSGYCWHVPLPNLHNSFRELDGKTTLATCEQFKYGQTHKMSLSKCDSPSCFIPRIAIHWPFSLRTVSFYSLISISFFSAHLNRYKELILVAFEQVCHHQFSLYNLSIQPSNRLQ